VYPPPPPHPACVFWYTCTLYIYGIGACIQDILGGHSCIYTQLPHVCVCVRVCMCVHVFVYVHSITVDKEVTGTVVRAMASHISRHTNKAWLIYE